MSKGFAGKRAALVVVALIGAAAHAELRPPYGGRLVGGLTSAPASFDPVTAQSWAEVSLVTLLYDGLYRLDAQGRPVPALAESMPAVSADRLEARMVVRAGVHFSDGRPLHAADVAASLKRAQGTAGAAWALAPVKSITHDGETLVFTLRRPVPELADLLAVPQLGVTPGGKPPAPRAPVGSGPFHLRAAGEHRLELEAVEHFAGRPYLDGAVLRWFDDGQEEPRAYEAGEADFSLRGASAFTGHEPKYPTAVSDGPATILVYIGFGKGHAEVLADVDFRRAISLAMNRGALRHVGTGERVVPAALPVSPDLGGATLPPADADAHLDRSTQALAAATARHPGLAATPYTLIVDRSRPDDVDVATRVVAALDRAGVPAAYAALAPAEYARRVAAGECDLYIGQLVAPSVEPTFEIAAAFAAGGDPWATGRLAEQPLTLADATLAFAARLPVVPLFHRAVAVHHKKSIVGFALDPLGRLDLASPFLVPASGAGGPGGSD